uniref:Uncharacterized protein n=1 Tax=uncultured prokaryote TaxID=198431 RepID=A0A0H5Q6R0_9ZZZZ|nr:hypothetical protein [uncultured prokaryote]
MKTVLSKLSDCFFNVSAGCILISLFEDKANSIYLSILSLFFALILTFILSKLEKKEIKNAIHNRRRIYNRRGCRRCYLRTKRTL